MQIEDEFFRSKAYRVAADATDIAGAAKHEYRVRHPDLTDEAVQALAWCYAFDYR